MTKGRKLENASSAIIIQANPNLFSCRQEAKQKTTENLNRFFFFKLILLWWYFVWDISNIN